MRKEILDKILKYWVLIPVGYFAFNLLTISLYYSPFYINILNYLDFTELLTIWFYHSLYLLFFLTLTFAVFWFLKILRPISRKDYHYYYFICNFLPLLILTFVILRYFVNINNLPTDSLELMRHSLNLLLPLCICLVTFINLIIAAYNTVKNIYKEVIKKEHTSHEELSAKLGIFLVIVFSFTLPVLEVQAYEYHDVSSITTIYTKTDTISSNKNLIVAGQTRNYLILYNKSNESSEIISLKDATKILISPIENSNNKQIKTPIKATKVPQ